MVAATGFPIPVADQDTEPFWEGCTRRELLVQRCGSCGRWIWQPRPLCPACHRDNPVWTRVSGTAEVASWTALHPPVLPAFAGRTPYVIVLAALAEGVRLVGYLTDADGGWLQTDGAAEAIAVGAALALTWHDQDGLRLPSWTLLEGGQR